MKNRILVKIEDYRSYMEKYKTDKLDVNNIIWAPSKSKLISRLFPLNEEIFNGRETNYEISKNNGGYLIIFKSKSETEYRFDLLKDPTIDIYHLGFSLSSTSDQSKYENLTEKGEAIDVFNRLTWILNDVKDKLDIHKFFIGATDDKRKNATYLYMMRFVSKWEKRESDQYDLGWGIYFEI